MEAERMETSHLLEMKWRANGRWHWPSAAMRFSSNSDFSDGVMESQDFATVIKAMPEVGIFNPKSVGSCI